MPLPIRRVLTLGAALAILQACGGSDSQGPAVTPIDGTWRGGVANGNTSFQVTMTLAESPPHVTGTGTITGNGPDCNVTVTGTRTGAAVALNIKCPGFIPIGFTGNEQDPTTIVGHIAGSGYPSTTFDLIKQ